MCVCVCCAQKPPGNCKDQCSAKNCLQTWNSPNHICTGGDADEKVSIDVFRCASPRCQLQDCSRCGDADYCFELCNQMKNDMIDEGFDMSGGYPACRSSCSEASDPNWMCFPDCRPDRDDVRFLFSFLKVRSFFLEKRRCGVSRKLCCHV